MNPKNCCLVVVEPGTRIWLLMTEPGASPVVVLPVAVPPVIANVANSPKPVLGVVSVMIFRAIDRWPAGNVIVITSPVAKSGSATESYPSELFPDDVVPGDEKIPIPAGGLDVVCKNVKPLFENKIP